MSREKTVPIDKARTMRRLASLSMTQEDLTNRLKLATNKQAFSRALGRGRISESAMDEIAQELDLAPEYISGASMPFDMGGDEANERFYNYDFHVSQVQPSRPLLITEMLWRMAGINPEELSPEVFWGLWFRVEETADKYIKEHDRQP